MGEGAVGIIYLEFGKVFDTVSHSIFLEKLAAHGLDMGKKKLPVWHCSRNSGEWKLIWWLVTSGVLGLLFDSWLSMS